MAVIISWWI